MIKLKILKLLLQNLNKKELSQIKHIINYLLKI
jgi:hypothetical protein